MQKTVKDLLREIDEQYCEELHLEKLNLEELAEYKQELFHDLEVAETIKGNNSYYERIVDYKQRLIREVERLELEKSADRYYEDFYLEQLEGYKQQIHEDLGQFQDIKSMNILDLFNSLNLAKNIEKELKDIEYWYNGSIASSVERGIAEIRGLLSCYQEIESFANCLNNFQSLFQVDEYLDKVKTNADKGQIEQGILNIQANLKTHAVISDEKEETPVVRRMSADEDYKQKFPMYLNILRKNLEDLKNIENISIGRFIRTLEVSDEVKGAIGIMDVWYQQLEDVGARMYAADIEELLEVHEQFKVLTPYFKGLRPRMKVGEYIASCDETSIGHEFLRNLSHLKTKLQNMENDYIDDGFERFSNAEVKEEEVPILRENTVTEHETIDVDIKDMSQDDIQYKGLATSISMNAESAPLKGTVVFPDVEEILEEISAMTREEETENEASVIVEDILEVEEVFEEVSEVSKVEDETAAEPQKESLENRMMSERIQAARDHIENLGRQWAKESMAKSMAEEPEQVQEVEQAQEIEQSQEVEQVQEEDSLLDEDFFINLDEPTVKPSASKKTIEKEDLMDEDKLIHFQKYFEKKKAFYMAKRDYQSQLKELRDQLKADLSEGLTFQFFQRYKEDYYQTNLQRIQENALHTYGDKMASKLDDDMSILTLVREINCKLAKLKSDFECLLKEEVTSYDGVVSTLSSMEDLSENEFYVIRETIPVMVNVIEKNMRATLKGKGTVPIRQRGLGSFVSNEKPKKAIIRSSSYHYDTCRMLSETIPEGISPEEFDQICDRLNRSLRKKKKIQEDSSDLWIAYKSSVENINSCVRSLKRASNDERVGILQKISKLSANYVNSYSEKSRGYSASFIQDIKEFFIDAYERIREIVTGDDGFEYEQGYDYTEDNGKDYTFYIGNDFSEKITKNDDLLFMDLDLEDPNFEELGAEKNHTETPDSSVKNLSVGEAMSTEHPYTLERAIHYADHVDFTETAQHTDLISFVSVDQLEQMIKKLADGESIDGYNEATDAFQKAIC